MSSVKHSVSPEKSLFTSLTSLDIAENDIGYLPPHTQLKSLTHLNLSNNRVNSTSHINWSNLISLQISSNPLSTFPIALSASFSNIRVLKCINCLPGRDSPAGSSEYLYQIPWDRFPLLESLDLSLNRLTSLPSSLSALTNLKTLYLSRNSLENIEPFSKCNQLIHLELQDNSISNLPLGFFSCRFLKSLDISNNQIVSLPSQIGCLKNLNHFNVSGNHLTELPDSLCSLSNLVQLSVSRNWLKALPNDLHFLESLQTFAFLGNSIQLIPDSIGGCHRLKVLEARGNLLMTLPPEIGNCQSLEMLLLGKNRIVALPETIVLLRKLKILDLEANFRIRLPNVLDKLINLQTLKLGFNGLDSVPSSIAQLQKLEYLLLSHNRLRTIPNLNTPNLKLLMLSHNFFSVTPSTPNCPNLITDMGVQYPDLSPNENHVSDDEDPLVTHSIVQPPPLIRLKLMLFISLIVIFVLSFLLLYLHVL